MTENQQKALVRMFSDVDERSITENAMRIISAARVAGELDNVEECCSIYFALVNIEIQRLVKNKDFMTHMESALGRIEKIVNAQFDKGNVDIDYIRKMFED